MPRKRMDRSFLVKTAPVSVSSGVATTPDSGSPVVAFAWPEAEYGVEVGHGPDGRPRVTFHFPPHSKTSGCSSTVEGAGAWASVPALTRPFAEALYATVRSLTERTRQEAVAHLGRFLAFLAEFLEHEGKNTVGFGLADLRTRHFEAYIADLEITRRKDGSQRSDTRKAKLLIPLRKTLAKLRKDPRYKASLAKPEDLSIRENLWPGRDSRRKSKYPLAVADLINIEAVCLREINLWIARFEEGERLIAEGQVLKATAPLRDKRLAIVLARFADDLPRYLSDRTRWRRHNSARNEALDAVGGSDVLLPYICATARTLQPFMILLAIHTAFNPYSIRSMSQHAVKPNPLLPAGAFLNIGDNAENRARIVASKTRARRDQIRTFLENDPDPANAIAIVRTVQRLTERLRPLAESAHQERLFLFPAAGKGKRHYLHDRIRSPTNNDIIITRAFQDFVRENGLPPFTMDRIRPTISEIADLLSGGDIKAQQVILNHRHADTTDRSYVSDEGRTRRRERLAEILNGRERHIVTRGRFDPREATTQGTHRAVTQGFECYDPYDSPIPGQTPGTLCTAWGDCPACPLASVKPGDPMVLAQLIRLDQAIDAAKEQLTPARWLHWGERQKKLRERMALFSNAAIRKAAREIDLKPLPPIE
jgi:integrase